MVDKRFPSHRQGLSAKTIFRSLDADRVQVGLKQLCAVPGFIIAGAVVPESPVMGVLGLAVHRSFLLEIRCIKLVCFLL